jgi:RimJ/RimL family protein N-acetyltransferase
MHIRPVKRTDTNMLFSFFEQLDSETSFLLFEPGERNPSLERQEKRLEQILASEQERMWVVTDEQQIVGYLGLRRGNANRTRHAAVIALGLLQTYCGQGWGTRLLQQAEAWAREHRIRRLGLTVMVHNERALRLYLKQGFAIEGLQKDSLLVDGNYVNEVGMAKILD